MDPTKLKSRSFASSTKTAEKAGASSGVNLWTETPQERQQRLEDEMMGRKRKAVVGAGGGGGPELEDESDEKRRKRERDQRLKDEVERHNVSISWLGLVKLKANTCSSSALPETPHYSTSTPL